MNPKFVADENIPFQVIQALREASYETPRALIVSTKFSITLIRDIIEHIT